MTRFLLLCLISVAAACGSDCDALRDCCRGLANNPDACNATSETACRNALDLLGSACE